MIDWLRRAQADPTVTIGGREVPLAIRRHPRATRLTMRLAPDGSEVRITLPKWGRTSDAGGYLMDHSRAAYLMGRKGEPIALLPVEADDRGESVAAELARWVS